MRRLVLEWVFERTYFTSFVISLFLCCICLFTLLLIFISWTNVFLWWCNLILNHLVCCYVDQINLALVTACMWWFRLLLIRNCLLTLSSVLKLGTEIIRIWPMKSNWRWQTIILSICRLYLLLKNFLVLKDGATHHITIQLHRLQLALISGASWSDLLSRSLLSLRKFLKFNPLQLFLSLLN